MKKQWLLGVLLGALVLACTGCGEKTGEASHVDEKTTVDYKDIPAFLASDFCKENEKIYVPEWDEEKFRLVNVYTSNKTSVFTFKDTATDAVGYYQITYNPYQKTVEDFADGDKERIVNVRKDGTAYDVCLTAKPSLENASYSLHYMPYEDMYVYIGTERSTSEEILADFDSFDLIPASEWKTK